MLTKAQAIEKLQRQLDLIGEIRSKPWASPDFEKWERDTEVAIGYVFGQDTRHLKDFIGISYSLAAWIINETPVSAHHRAFQDGLDSAASVLKSMIDEVGEYWNGESVLPTPMVAIEHICNRFHLVAKRLCSRHDSRATLNVEDEYDVQDLMHALLTLEFDDIRPEEWTPSYAGSGSRVDFLLKQERMVVEAKKTRKGLGAREVGEQLIIDVQRYQSHPDCLALICFVYDPEGKIANPRGLENDLNRQHDGLEVKVLIVPKGL